MSAADKLAQVLAEHGDWGYGHGAFIQCDCGAHVGFPDDDGHYKGKRAHAAHVAAVVLAHLKESGAMSVWRFTYPATARTVERTTIIWEHDIEEQP